MGFMYYFFKAMTYMGMATLFLAFAVFILLVIGVLLI